MHKYKVALNVDAMYRAKVKAFGESKFNSVYVEKVKGGMKSGRD